MKNGFEYVQVKRGRSWAIYEQKREGRVIAYEVFRIKTRKAGKVFGKWQPEREALPGKEEFGKTAWTVSTLTKAFRYVKFINYKNKLR
jgi:hypothetical protein